jgi:hypothetical protein
MRTIENPSSLPWETRRRSDIWAFGKLLSMLVNLESDNSKRALFQEVVEGAMNKDLSLRLDLIALLPNLKKHCNNRLIHIFARSDHQNHHLLFPLDLFKNKDYCKNVM